METEERIATVGQEFVVGAIEKDSVLWHLALRVVKAEDDLDEVASETRSLIMVNSARIASGGPSPVGAGVVPGEVSEMARRYEVALAILQDRQEALRIAALVTA